MRPRKQVAILVSFRPIGRIGASFNNPTVDLFEAFEEEDPRLSCTVMGQPTMVYHGYKADYDLTEQMTPYLNRKAALMPGERPSITKSSSYNVRKARHAETLLNHAEAAYIWEKKVRPEIW